jgi:hypothetical protein
MSEADFALYASWFSACALAASVFFTAYARWCLRDAIARLEEAKSFHDRVGEVLAAFGPSPSDDDDPDDDPDPGENADPEPEPECLRLAA